MRRDSHRSAQAIRLAIGAYLVFIAAMVSYLWIVNRLADLRLAEAALHLSATTLAFLGGHHVLSGLMAWRLRIPRVLPDMGLNAALAFAALLLLGFHQRELLPHSSALQGMAFLALGHALVIDLRHIVNQGRSHIATPVAYFGLLATGTLFGVLVVAMYVYIQQAPRP